MKRIFISLPYGHPDNNVRLERAEIAEKYFIKLLKEGFCPVSPIVTGHPLVEKYKLEATFDFWDAYCIAELRTCDEIHILKIEGWTISFGVMKEIDVADALNILVRKIDME